MGVGDGNLASQLEEAMFGSPAPVPAPSAAPVEEESLTGEDQSPQATETSDSADVDTEETSKESSEVDVEQVEEAEIQDLKELAEALEVEPSFLYSLKVPIGDGGGDPITLGELKDQYQEYQKATRQKEDLSKESQTLAELRNQQTAEFQRTMQGAQAILGMMQQRMLARYNGIDWAKLRDDDPAEFAAKQADYQRDQQEIQGTYMQAQQLLQQYQAQVDAQRNSWLNKNRTRIREVIPEWNNQKIAEQESAQIQGMMVSEYEFSPQEIASIADYRVARALRDLYMLKSMKGQTPEVAKKMSKLPKLRRPGAAKGPEQTKLSQVKAKVARAKQTGEKSDILAAQRALLEDAGEI